MLQERATSLNRNRAGMEARQKLDTCYVEARKRYIHAISQFSVGQEDAVRIIESAKHQTRKAMLEFIAVVCAIDPEFALAVSQDLEQVTEILN
jgi:hypothetical protein